MAEPHTTIRDFRTVESPRSTELLILDEKYRLTADMDVTTFYKTISAKGKEVMKIRRSQGERMYKAPLGYKNARDEEGRSILVIDPETYPWVQRAKELHAQGMSIRKICAEMNRLGLRSTQGKMIGPSSMLKLLRYSETQALVEVTCLRAISHPHSK